VTFGCFVVGRFGVGFGGEQLSMCMHLLLWTAVKSVKFINLEKYEDI
jgi:hypothetical protein